MNQQFKQRESQAPFAPEYEPAKGGVAYNFIRELNVVLVRRAL
jgi:hypothetical protein